MGSPLAAFAMPRRGVAGCVETRSQPEGFVELDILSNQGARGNIENDQTAISVAGNHSGNIFLVKAVCGLTCSGLSPHFAFLLSISHI